MNTSKLFLAGLIVATLSAAQAQVARETEAQIKARQALEQKMNELNAAPAATTPAKAAPAKPAVAPAPKPAPVAAPVQPVVQPAPAPAAAPVAVQATPTVAPVAAPAPVVVQEDPAAARAREEALRKAMEKSSSGFSEVPPPSSIGNVNQAQLQVAPAPSPQPGAKTPAAEPVKAPVTVTSSAKPPRAEGYQPLPAPPSPLNASKEAQLAELLRQYRADAITPEQYHTQRAKIIGAP